VEVADPGVGVVATPTPPVATRIVELFGVLCSGEWGGELKLPGEEPASPVSMAGEHGNYAPRRGPAARREKSTGEYTGRKENQPGNGI